ncbi:MAG TPA: hypothetical protein VKT73_10370 [Xanthobacteraceae bacterium]|nr:hypothetical protein [Xanthobacteraceae bacterium]
MNNDDRAHDVAESSFKKKERRLQEGKKAMAEHNAAMRADDAKTARLRALRLARDAAAAAAPPEVAKPRLRIKKKKITVASPPVAPAIEPAEGEKLHDRSE